MQITVTQEHIDNGRRHVPHKCPIVLALKDAGFENPQVGPTKFAIGGKNAREIFVLGWRGSRFTERFDSVDKVKPSTFRFKKANKKEA